MIVPELGRYATVVLSSYAVTLGLLALLIGWTFGRGARVKAALAEIEARHGSARHG